MRDARAMANAMADLLSDPEKAAKIGRAARKRVERVFQWSDAASRLVDVFEETLRASHRRSRAA
jgi:glycosyltransferase involved in cell wall biosynthesis